MTIFFLLLAACGLAGTALLARRPAAPRDQAFGAELGRAEMEAAADPRVSALEERVRRLEDALALYDLETACGRPPRRASAPAPAPLPDYPSSLERGQRASSRQRFPAPSARMSRVWDAARTQSDPREIARMLNMGIGEVELALKAAGLDRGERAGW